MCTSLSLPDASFCNQSMMLSWDSAEQIPAQSVGFFLAVFPCGSVGKEFACNAGDLGSIPGLGKSPGEGKGYKLQYSGLENAMDCIVHGVAKRRTLLSNFLFHFFLAISVGGRQRGVQRCRSKQELTHSAVPPFSPSCGATESGLQGCCSISLRACCQHPLLRGLHSALWGPSSMDVRRLSNPRPQPWGWQLLPRTATPHPIPYSRGPRALDQGLVLRSVSNQAAQQEVSGGQVSEAHPYLHPLSITHVPT